MFSLRAFNYYSREVTVLVIRFWTSHERKHHLRREKSTASMTHIVVLVCFWCTRREATKLQLNRFMAWIFILSCHRVSMVRLKFSLAMQTQHSHLCRNDMHSHTHTHTCFHSIFNLMIFNCTRYMERVWFAHWR